jgi:hypothetical protein
MPDNATINVSFLQLIWRSFCFGCGWALWDAQAADAPLRIDFNKDAHTQSGWESMSREDRDFGKDWSRRFQNGYILQLNPVGNLVLDTRDRRTINGGGSASEMWRDFIYVPRSLGPNEGLDLLLGGLIPYATYPVTIWSYDTSSRDTRRSLWNGMPFAFNGELPEPETLNDYDLTFSIVAGSDGYALIRARTDSPPGPYFNVLINGMEIGTPSSVPEQAVGVTLSSQEVFRGDPVGTLVGNLHTLGVTPGEAPVYALVKGMGDDDNDRFIIEGHRLKTRKSMIALSQGTTLTLRIRSTSPVESFIETIIDIQVSNGEGFVEPLRINEIMANNRQAHFDGDGNAVDWLELYNPRDEPVSLAGYALTDDPDDLGKWMFPDLTIPARDYILLYGGTPYLGGTRPPDYKDARGYDHFPFNLDADGEFLALVRPDGRSLEDVLDPGFPRQYQDVSFGRDSDLQWAFYLSPTPGKANGDGLPGVVEDPQFSMERGFYDTTLRVTLQTGTERANIRYTLDHSMPSARNGFDYSRPIHIANTTTLRAVAMRDDWRPSNVETHTYIFVDQVARQPANPEGWPDTWGRNPEVDRNDGRGNGTVPADYEMDPRVVDNTIPGYGIREALLDIPSISIVMQQDDFIKPGAGIYAIPQKRIEKKCSVEYILPDGREGFQEDCKIELHGNSSRRPWRMQKHSMRLTFSKAVGASKLEYSLFQDSPVKRFNQLVLRACFTDSWGLVSWGGSRYRPNDSQYIRDVWMKESLRDMGQPSSFGHFVHVYVNGLYFGLHNLTERLGDDFFASHLGGNEEDWEVNKDFSRPGKRWYQMMGIDVSTPGGYAEIQAYIDTENLADYFLLHFYADAEDWPHQNGYAAANTRSGDGKFRFFVWDQEIALDKFTWNRYDHTAGVGALFQKMRRVPAFRLLLADRAQKHLFNKGGLSMEASQMRYRGLADLIDKAIVAESARWGDTQASTPYGNRVQQPNPRTQVDHDHYPPAPHAPDIYFTREDSWLVERDNVLHHYIPTLHDTSSPHAILNELRAEGLYPAIDAPLMLLREGHVSPESLLEYSVPKGIIFYTMDGTDPLSAASQTQTILINDGHVASALVPTDDSLGRSWMDRGFVEGDSWKRGRTGVGYELMPSDYKGFIGLDVSEMRNRNSSVYVRVPFSVDTLPSIHTRISMELQMRYDDGFVAYLNGTRIWQSNQMGAVPRWNASALISRADAEASQFESFDVSRYMHLLEEGNNLLAIHGLNASMNSSDLLITPKLVLTHTGEIRAQGPVQRYDAPIRLTESVQMNARTYDQGVWSALSQAEYTLELPAAAGNLVISELMYHPAGTEDLEFIELLNISPRNISLEGVRFTDGIDFSFQGDWTLAPGGCVLLVRSMKAFEPLAPNVALTGVFQNNTGLSNGGETITMVDQDGSTIVSFQYDDQGPWSGQADGKGHSLVLKDPYDNADPRDPASWQQSFMPGGTPGMHVDVTFTGDPKADLDRDGLPALAEYYFGTSDLKVDDRRKVIQWSIDTYTDLEHPGLYWTLRFPHDMTVQDVQVIIEFSSDLVHWSDASGRLLPTGVLSHDNKLETRVFRTSESVEVHEQAFFRLRFQ